MKTKNYFYLIAMVIGSILISCEGVEDLESCDGEDLADTFCEQLDIDLIATFCSDGVNNSYYTYNGVDYQCDGIEASSCESALSNITAQMQKDEPDCFAKKKSTDFESANKKISIMAENLLLEVRNKSFN